MFESLFAAAGKKKTPKIFTKLEHFRRRPMTKVEKEKYIAAVLRELERKTNKDGSKAERLTKREKEMMIDKFLLALGAAPVPKKRGKLRRKKTKDKA